MRRIHSTGLALWAAGVVLGCAPAVAWAAKPKDLIEEGIALRRAGRDAEALRKLQAAYEAEPSPRAAAQLGLCFQALGRWSEADAKLAEALSAANDPWVHTNRAPLKESLEVVKSHVGRVEVLGSPEGAHVLLNGLAVGALPLPDAVPVNEGLVDVEVKADGHVPERRSFSIGGGAYQRVVVRLQPLPVPSAPRVAESAPGLATREAPEAASSSSTSGWLWGGLALAVAGGVAAALLLGRPEPKSPGFDDAGDLR